MLTNFYVLLCISQPPLQLNWGYMPAYVMRCFQIKTFKTMGTPPSLSSRILLTLGAKSSKSHSYEIEEGQPIHTWLSVSEK